MATGQASFDPDDFRRRDSEREERAREQARIDAMRASQERGERQRREEQRSQDRLMDVVNDPSVSVDSEMMKAINDPSMVMTSNGELARITRRPSSPFANQFRFDKIAPRPKRRKKNPKLAQAFRQANARYRTKSGKLRKGRTQGDIARLAHRLMKKM
jgi:hypothetical protein